MAARKLITSWHALTLLQSFTHYEMAVLKLIALLLLQSCKRAVMATPKLITMSKYRCKWLG
eukprot:322394-Karenia_brevis.AAC.1